MREILTIIHYEYKMLFKRIASWGILLAATAIALFDSLPSKSNLARLEFLNQPAYFIYRTMSLDALIMAFGLMFLMSNRFMIDEKTQVKSLMMASTLQKGQYVLGKLLGSFLYTFTMLCTFLLLNTVVYYVTSPFEISAADCIAPILKAIVVSALPVAIFISFCSAALPALIDIRLFYLLSVLLFVINAVNVGSANAMPFYLITSGDLVRFVWVHPKWTQIDMGSVLANLLFLTVSGMISCSLLFLKRGFWRSE